jgi:putative serine protease PepD
MALALAASTIGGGAVGAVTATRWLAPPQPVAAAAAPQTISAAPPATTSVAGAVYAKVGPAVVEILSASSAHGGSMVGIGSGFVVDARGLVLTNNHVVDGARTMRVRFSNGVVREAQVLGRDRGLDLALLRVKLPAGVPVAPLGDSDSVQVGDTAIAIGSPFGIEQTVTQGIISAVQRDWQPGYGRIQRNLLQTDAPLNPGNSGGPLLNDRGEVIGINTMIESPVRGSVGIGFAVPINAAKQVLPQLEAGAQLEPVWLGISGLALDATLAREHGVAVQSGVLVTDGAAGGPAARAGLRPAQPAANGGAGRGGDVITAVDGKPVTDVRDIAAAIIGHQPGDTVTLTIVRDGQTRQVPVTLQAWPANG